eukprot:64098-Rhodomonas_salina.1
MCNALREKTDMLQAVRLAVCCHLLQRHRHGEHRSDQTHSTDAGVWRAVRCCAGSQNGRPLRT